MGLDIYHRQLTITPENKGDFFYIDEWDLDCNVSLKSKSKSRQTKVVRVTEELTFCDHVRTTLQRRSAENDTSAETRNCPSKTLLENHLKMLIRSH